LNRIDPTDLMVGDQMVDTLANTFYWFQKARPDSTNKDIHSQLGVHFEEVVEMIDELTPLNTQAKNRIEKARDALHELAEFLKLHDDVVEVLPYQRIAMIDAIADQLVTVTGVGQTLKMDPVGALAEVNRSNFTKFDENGDPIRDPVTHKILKGPNYSKADLHPYI
jgi:predicted HAD superfamily Cof-like phosphohydrolase